MPNAEIRRCISCMKEIGEEELCPHCGYSQQTPYLPNYLPPHTILQERYMVGKLIKKNGASATYMGYDFVLESAVILEEYMPDTLATRCRENNSLVPNIGDEAQYKALLYDFVELAKTLTKMRSLSAIIPTLDVFEENNTVYSVRQYIPYIPLREYLIKVGGEISWEQIKTMFAPIFSILSAMHSSANLLHRGISPDTIVVDKNENLKLTGFAIAELRTTRSELASELYPGYTSPEQYSSTNWQGTWSDVYAIAAVLYKCLSGTMPPEATSRITNDNLVPLYKLNKSVPINISNAIQKAMSISPQKRTQTIELFLCDLTETAEFLEAEEKTPQPENKSKKKNWIWISLIILGILVVGTVGFFLIRYLLSEDDPTLPLVSDTSDISSTVSENSSKPQDESASSKGDTSKESLYSVPDFKNKYIENIMANSTYTDKFTIITEEKFSDSVEKGMVIEQSPQADEPIAPKGEVKLIVSKGKQIVTMPNLSGRTLEYAKNTLDEMGIQYSIQEQENSEYAAGYVIETSPGNGSSVDISKDTVTIFVAKESTSN